VKRRVDEDRGRRMDAQADRHDHVDLIPVPAPQPSLLERGEPGEPGSRAAVQRRCPPFLRPRERPGLQYDDVRSAHRPSQRTDLPTHVVSGDPQVEQLTPIHDSGLSAGELGQTGHRLECMASSGHADTFGDLIPPAEEPPPEAVDDAPPEGTRPR